MCQAHSIHMQGCMPAYNHRWPKAPKTYPGNTHAEIVVHIKAVSPPPTIKHPIQPRLSATQILSVVSELECSICLGVLTQPMQLPCDRLVCATCLIEWIHVTAAYCTANKLVATVDQILVELNSVNQTRFIR